MNRTIASAIIILALMASSITALQTLEVAKANYYPPPSIEIFSPIPAPDIHSNASVMLNVRVNVLPSESDITFLRYSLDGKANATLTNLTKEDNVWYWTTTEGVFEQGKAFSVEAFLGNIAESNHTLTVYAHYADGKEMSRSREFTVDTDYTLFIPPELLLLSPLNQTYSANEIPLTFYINGTIQSVSYVLDNRGGNTSLSSIGNTTLTGISDGMHKLTVAVWTERGFASQSVFFTVAQETNTQQQSLQTTLMIGAIVVCIASVAIGIIIFKKRKHP